MNIVFVGIRTDDEPSRTTLGNGDENRSGIFTLVFRLDESPGSTQTEG